MGESDGRLVVDLSRAEFEFLLGCVNETMEAVEDWEFSTRLGVDKSEARRVRDRLRELAAGLPPAG